MTLLVSGKQVGRDNSEGNMGKFICLSHDEFNKSSGGDKRGPDLSLEEALPAKIVIRLSLRVIS